MFSMFDPNTEVTSGLEQSSRSSRTSFTKRSLTVSSLVCLRRSRRRVSSCFCLIYCSVVHFKMKCSVSSQFVLHMRHMSETVCWLNFCLWACKVYVPVRMRAFTDAFETARRLCVVVFQIMCGVEAGSF